MTVHRALRELTVEGWLDRTQGAGTFVAEPKPQSAVMEIHSIKEEIEARGHRHSAEVLRAAARGGPGPGGGPARVWNGAHRSFGPSSCIARTVRRFSLEDRYVSPEMAPDYLDPRTSSQLRPMTI